jgi:hypothetical protein
VSWSGDDLESGVFGCVVERSVAGGAWSHVAIPKFGSATTWVVTVPPGVETQFRLRAFDLAGNTSAWSAAWTMFPPPRLRLGGADRYATAAAISEATYAPGAEVAYVATGKGFADALAGAPPAGGGSPYRSARGPVLLVPGTSIPPVVAAELARLKPRTIIVLGGPAAVSDGVVVQLDAYTDGLIYRFGGVDRYATAAVISANTYPEGVPVAYIATGRDFPDALAGAAAAGAAGGPVLLVPGTSIPPVVAAELARLRPAKIIVLGGPAAVSDGVVVQLDAYTDGLIYRFARRSVWHRRQISANSYAPACRSCTSQPADFPMPSPVPPRPRCARSNFSAGTSIPLVIDAELAPPAVTDHRGRRPSGRGRRRVCPAGDVYGRLIGERAAPAGFARVSAAQPDDRERPDAGSQSPPVASATTNAARMPVEQVLGQGRSGSRGPVRAGQTSCYSLKRSSFQGSASLW